MNGKETDEGMLKLKEITKDNYEEVLKLKVSESQRNYVSTTEYSLAQAWAYKETAFPFAIYAGEVMVGFVMLGYYEARNQYTLWKFMIDESHQKKGYGRAALQLAIDYLQKTHGATEVYTGVALGNKVAKHLYCSVGFEETGVVEDGMEEMRLLLKNEFI